MTDQNRQYPAKVKRIVDGDTIDLEVDLGFGVRKSIRMRLSGVNTDEVFGVSHDSEEFQKGIDQKKFVADLIPEGSSVILVDRGETGKYGRHLGDILVGDRLLSEQILEQFDYLEEDYGESW